MTSLSRYAFVLVAGPHGLNRVTLLRTPRPVPRPDPDAGPALPLHIPFHLPVPAARHSGWMARYRGDREPAPGVPPGWCPPDGPALKALREGAGLPQRAAAAVGDLQPSVVSDVETGKRRAGKGISAACLYAYVTALEAARR